MRELRLAVLAVSMLLATTLGYAAPFAYFVTPGGSLLVIDTATNTTAAAPIAIGANPFAAAVNPGGTRVYATNFGGSSVSVVDTSTISVITTIPVAAGPQGVAVNPAGTRVYVASFTGGTVSVIDAGTNTVLSPVPVAGATDVVVNPAGTRLYVTGDSGVTVIDTSNNAILTTIAPAGTSSLIGMAVTPDGSRLYVRDLNNKVQVINTATNTFLTPITLATPFTINGVAVNPAGTRVYVSNGTSISVIDTATNTVLTTVPLGTMSGAINGVAVTPDGAHVYAATASGVLSLDTATNTFVPVLPTSVRALGHFIGPLVATFTVINTNDSGVGSLRDAIVQANASPGTNIVDFAPGLTGTITLTSGQIQVADALTIIGPGRNNLTIDGNASSRIFSIFLTDPACPALDGPDYLVSISGLRLTNARRNADSSGGAIFTEHSLALDSVVVENSQAKSGGGLSVNIQYPAQALTITNSQFNNNIAKPLSVTTATEIRGGAIAIVERCSGTNTTPVTVTIANSVFNGNRVQPTTLEGKGGAILAYTDADLTITDTRMIGNGIDIPVPPVADAIYGGGGFYGRAKTLRIERSEIADNVADVGGGLRFFNNLPSLQTPGTAMAVTIVNSTISGNVVSATAGALFAFGNVAVELDNTTVSDNTAAATRTGGILFNTGATSPASAGNALAGTLKLVSSIVANSQTGPNDLSTNLAVIPTFTVDATNSLIETICPSPSCEITIAGTGNLIAVDPLLGPLASNGGASRTHAVLAGSPVLNAGSNPLALTTDQRGAGFPRVSGAAADMGAFELSPPTLSSVVSRRVHGAAGTFDLALSAVTTNPTIEPRFGPAQTLVFTFNKAVTAGTATVTEGTATAGVPIFNGSEIIVPLTGVTNQQYVTVSLTNVTASDGGTGGVGAIRVGFLAGDVSQNRVVTLSDLGQVNAQIAQPVTAANYLKDVNASGTLSLADKGQTNTQLTRALPAP